MKTEKTYGQLQQLRATADLILQSPTQGGKDEDIQPRVILGRVVKKACKPLEEYEEQLEDLRLKHCLKDEKTKRILRDDRGKYEFSEEGLRAFQTEGKALQRTVVDVHFDNTWPYSELLATLPKASQPFNQWEDVKEVFEPFYHNEA